MAIKIVTDTLGDIPPDVAEELDITIVPVNIMFGTDVYLDGVDITIEEVYERLVSSKTPPTTSAPPIGSFVEAYEKAAEEADEILVITVNSKWSATHESALQAAEQMTKKRRIEVIDSRVGCGAQGLLVIAAAKAVKAGASFNEVVKSTHDNMQRIDICYCFDTLEYLYRGGRIGRAKALMGSLLKVHPITTIKDGEAYPVGRERSREKAIDHLVNFALGYSQIEELMVEHATTPDEAEQIVERLSIKFPKERIYRSRVSPVIGAYVGPRVLSVSLLGEK